MTILACGQCWMTIAQVVAVVSTCGGTVFYFIKQFLGFDNERN